MNIYFSELSVYVEAIINAISPSSSTFSTTILTVSSILDAFYSTKVCRQINKDHACLSRVLRVPIYERARLYTEFSKTYPFSNLVSMIVPKEMERRKVRTHAREAV